MQPYPVSSSKKWILVLGCGLIAVCLCASLVVAASAAVYAASSGWTPPWVIPTPTLEVGAQMDLIQQQVVGLRGLQANETVTRTLLSPEELRENVTNDFLEDYSQEEAQQDALILSSFGLLEPHFDLYGFYLELYSEQISGYYDNETKEMFVVQGSGFNGPERLTYAHEFNHALQDQTYDIRNGLKYNEEDCDDGTERCLGIQALLEGDATLLELKWFENHATWSDRQQVMDFYDELDSPVYDNAPSFMKEDFIFPYQAGYSFVEALFNQGGWQAVDQAFRLPPISSEQVLHPELYPIEQPLAVSLPDFTQALGAGWQEIDRGVMGEWYTYLILAHGLSESSRIETEQAQTAATGWGGDAYIVYLHTETQALAMVLATVWDSAAEAQEFSQSFQEYADARFGAGPEQMQWRGTDGLHRFIERGSQTAWLLAPDETALHAMFQNLPETFIP